MRVLVTGATGYIGGRLVPRLLRAGHEVTVLVRDPSAVAGRAWGDQVKVVHGDLLRPETLVGLGKRLDAAYYLVHSMTGHKDFERVDREAARNFRSSFGGLVIYLGGLQPDGEASAHLRSRADVGRILAEGGPVTEIRAGPVIGSGSASFEMVRYLTERLPVMVTPWWVTNPVQPIAVADVLRYLEAALETEPAGVVDVGGEVLSFRAMMRGYADVRGLRRAMFRVPVLAPTLAARWVQFITPITNKIAVPLLAGIVHPVTADLERAKQVWPQIHPIGYEEAVRCAIARVDLHDVETRWTSAGGEPVTRIEDWENLVREVRVHDCGASPEDVFAVIEGLGGDGGWLTMDWAWRVRGGFDRLIGGPGLRRGRRHPEALRVGDALDFWRVEEIDRPRLLRLRAEMKVPGKAWLEFRVEPHDGGTRLTQTAYFEPRGFAGWAYWNGLLPVHRMIFRRLPRAIARHALGH